MEQEQAKIRQHPVISEFSALAEGFFVNGAIDFPVLQTPDFFKFWRHLMIARYLPDENDFKILMWGSHIASSHGKDLSGKKFTEAGFGNKLQFFHDFHKSVMEGGEIVFKSGVFSWENKQFLKWYQVKMPLRRGQSIHETVSCICFEET